MFKNKRLKGKGQKYKQRKSTLWATCGLVEGDTPYLWSVRKGTNCICSVVLQYVLLYGNMFYLMAICSIECQYVLLNGKMFCCIAIYSYLMGVDAIDQTICPSVLGMTKCSIAFGR